MYADSLQEPHNCDASSRHTCVIGTDRRMDLGVSTGATDRQPVTRRLVWLHGNEGSAFQIGLETCQDVLNPVNNLRGAQALQS